MMPPGDWQSGIKVTELVARVREECVQFGGLDACVVRAAETVPFVSQMRAAHTHTHTHTHTYTLTHMHTHTHTHKQYSFANLLK